MAAPVADEHADTVLELSGIRRAYGRHEILTGIDLSVRRGEIVGLLGPNGSGKTTTLRIAAGYLWPDSGEVRLCGEAASPATRNLRKRLGYLPENVPLYDPLTVERHLQFIAQARGLLGVDRSDAVEAVLEQCGLTAMRTRVISQLSKGFRQRVGLAQAQLGGTDLLLLDEPTSALDPFQIVEARELIQRSAKGRGVVFSTHVLQEVTALCSRAVFLHEGVLIELPLTPGTPPAALEAELASIVRERGGAAP